MTKARQRRLRCTARLKEVMGGHFSALAKASKTGSAPIAWCTSVGPAEILRALGFEVYFPENHGAALGASRMANRVMPRAHAMGYSQEICSYLTSDIGAHLAGVTPLAKAGLESIPKADVLVFSTNQCRDVREWFEYYGREWSVPVLGITAPRSVDQVEQAIVDDVTFQMEALIPPLESIAGTSMDSARLSEVVKLSRECSDLWKRCLQTAQTIPSPLTFFDGTIQMGPAVVLRGSAEATAYYRVLLEELQERVAGGVAAVEGEKYRLFWDGMPIWGKLSDNSTLLAEMKTCVVASTYCNSWIFDALDASDPLPSMARASLELFIARSEGAKQWVLEEMIEAFQVDGLVFHDSRTCPNNSNARYGMPARLQKKTGVPVLVIDGDLNDLRCYSDEQARTNFEGFIEQIADSKAFRSRVES